MLMLKMGATPIWNLVISVTKMQLQTPMLTVNDPVNLHCTHTKSQMQTLTQMRTCEWSFKPNTHFPKTLHSESFRSDYDYYMLR